MDLIYLNILNMFFIKNQILNKWLARKYIKYSDDYVQKKNC